MKFVSLVVAAAFSVGLVEASLGGDHHGESHVLRARQFGRGNFRKNRNGGNGGSRSQSSSAAGTTTSVASSTSAASSSASASSTASSANNNSNQNNDDDPQTSLTLDPSQIGSNIAENGLANATAGQAASLTSTNNFINFCLTQSNLPISNGLQVKTGSCNPIPMGVIAATTNMPSCKFTFPENLGTIQSDTDFTVTMALSHLQAGTFVNPNTNYFGGPQTVNSDGDIIGHSHIVIQAMNSITDSTLLDSSTFTFFKGIDAAASNGVLSQDVAGGVPSGSYRMCTINSSANHQPVLVAIAQHGSLDDCIYFTATDDGQASNDSSGNGNNAAATTTASSAAASATSDNNNNGGDNSNDGGNNNNGGSSSSNNSGNNGGNRNFARTVTATVCSAVTATAKSRLRQRLEAMDANNVLALA